MALKKRPLWSNARLIFTKEPLFVWAPCVCVLYKNLEHNETVRYSTCSCFETALARYLGLSQQRQLKAELILANKNKFSMRIWVLRIFKEIIKWHLHKGTVCKELPPQCKIFSPTAQVVLNLFTWDARGEIYFVGRINLKIILLAMSLC